MSAAAAGELDAEAEAAGVAARDDAVARAVAEAGADGETEIAGVGAAATETTTGVLNTLACSTLRTPSQDSATARQVAASQTSEYPIRHRIPVIMPYGPIVACLVVVEDDPLTRAGLIKHLTSRGHAVRSAGTGLDGIREVTRGTPPDAVILDLGLPDLDGTQVLRMIRGVTDVPVIVATARDTEEEIISVLNDGADDYLVKPFSPEHLDARLRAVLRRAGTDTRSILTVGTLAVDIGGRQATLDGQPLDLTRREFDLLAYLAARPGAVVTRRELLIEVWRQPYGDDKTIDVHLSWLRRKLGETAALPRYLYTIRGVGVRLQAP
jgi:DNA-binding response OmpR family regulator